MGHLHTCPLHPKSMLTTSLSHILHNEEKRDNTFDYIFHSQLKKIAPKLLRLFDLNSFPVGCDLSRPLMHRYSPSLSLYHCREHKPKFQIINNW